ncbi:hypothetical protein NQ315_014032 [Exocentrus adspersus]|uniref:Reverse transcriptase n=1 Tax=Exocentrus adspersus TaxID=1586481 RepID=A0AAV8VC32_9CUCU|nr:hypothetical protein NQ315_014032 [Exocentrus adspersus]
MKLSLVRYALRVAIENRGGGLNQRQFGFRKGRSTLGALEMLLAEVKRVTGPGSQKWCAIVLFDVKNAGPRQAKSKALAGVVSSILLYAAPIWKDAVRVATNKGRLASAQTKATLRVISAYRTVSNEAAQVLAGIAPIHLMVGERARLYGRQHVDEGIKKMERAVTEDMWQEEWAGCHKGAWTRRLIADLRPFIRRKHGQLEYYSTQFLTGHGSFKTYLRRIGKAESELCERCGETDTPEHVLFYCERWAARKERMSREIGEELRVDNIMELACASERAWTVIIGGVTDIMKMKEEELRRYAD